MRAPGIGWPRTIAAVTTSVAVVFLLLAAALGGIHRDSVPDRIVAYLLAGALAAATMFLVRGPARSGAGVAAFAVAAWIAWALATARDAIPDVAPWWLGVAAAAALGWRGSR